MYGLCELIIAFVILWCIPPIRHTIEFVFDFVRECCRELSSRISFSAKYRLHHHPISRQKFRDIMNSYTGNDSNNDTDSDVKPNPYAKYDFRQPSDTTFSDISPYGNSDYIYDNNSNNNYNSDSNYNDSDDNQVISFLDVEPSNYNQEGPFKDPCVGTYLNHKNELHYAYKFQYLDHGQRHYYYLNTENDITFISGSKIDNNFDYD